MNHQSILHSQFNVQQLRTDEIINLLTYVNECLHNISVTYSCQKHILHTDLTLESVRH